MTIGAYDHRTSFEPSTAQWRLEYWRRVEHALDAQEFADRVHGRYETPFELSNAITAVVRANIRLAQVQLGLATASASNRDPE